MGLCSTLIDIAALGAVINKVESAIGKLDTAVDPADLAPYTEAIQDTKQAIEQLKEDYAQTGMVDKDGVDQLQSNILNLEAIKDLPNTLSDPSQITQVQSALDDFGDIDLQLGAILSPISTTTTMAPVTLSQSNLVAILSKVHGTLGELESKVDPESLAPHAEAILAAKEATKKVWDDFTNTGVVNVDKLAELHAVVLDLIDVSDLQSSLTDPSAIAQVKKTPEDLAAVEVTLAEILNLTSTSSTEATTSASIDIASLGAVIAKVQRAIDKLDTTIDPEDLAPYKETIKEAKNAINNVKIRI